jgi:hypothetical protein
MHKFFMHQCFKGSTLWLLAAKEERPATKKRLMLLLLLMLVIGSGRASAMRQSLP